MLGLRKLKDGAINSLFGEELFQKDPPKVNFIFTVTVRIFFNLN